MDIRDNLPYIGIGNYQSEPCAGGTHFKWVLKSFDFEEDTISNLKNDSLLIRQI